MIYYFSSYVTTKLYWPLNHIRSFDYLQTDPALNSYLKTTILKVWEKQKNNSEHKAISGQGKELDGRDPGPFNELWSNSVFDSNVWLRQCKIKSNIWTCSVLPREAWQPTSLYLEAYSAQYYWLHGNCVWLAGT